MPDPASSAPRRSRFVPVAAVVTCVVLAGCAGALFLFDSGDERVGCNSLLENERIHSALGDAYDSDMSCTRLGAEIKKATTGIQPGQHSLRQAQAMKDVILAVHDELGTADGRVDRQLSLPLARSLADYAADTETILGIGNADYVRRAVPDEPAWEDEHGVHMSVGNVWLLPVVRAVSEDPAAYVTLSKAATRQAAAGLTAVKPGTTGPGLALPSTRNARLLGTWSGVAADVRRDVGKEAAAKWDRAVFEGLTKNTVEPPSYAQDPVNHLVTSWQRELLTRGADNNAEAFEEQGAVLVDAWAKAMPLDSAQRESLRQDALKTSFNAQNSALGRLD